MSIADIGSLAGNLVGAIMGGQDDGGRSAQYDFAQHAIEWKVKDAQAAGIHPLYALGAPTMSFQPTVTGGAGWGDSLSSMGQNIDDALARGMPREGQLDAMDKAAKGLQLKNYELQNELLATQIAKMRQSVLSKPAVPGFSPGDGIQGASASGANTGSGNWMYGPQADAQAIEDRYDDFIAAPYGVYSFVRDLGYNVGMWAARNFNRFGAAVAAKKKPLSSYYNAKVGR